MLRVLCIKRLIAFWEKHNFIIPFFVWRISQKQMIGCVVIPLLMSFILSLNGINTQISYALGCMLGHMLISPKSCFFTGFLNVCLNVILSLKVITSIFSYSVLSYSVLSYSVHNLKAFACFMAQSWSVSFHCWENCFLRILHSLRPIKLENFPQLSIAQMRTWKSLFPEKKN